LVQEWFLVFGGSSGKSKTAQATNNVSPQPFTDGRTLEEIHKPISGSTRECQL
jgi:hypothetical protein